MIAIAPFHLNIPILYHYKVIDIKRLVWAIVLSTAKAMREPVKDKANKFPHLFI